MNHRQDDAPELMEIIQNLTKGTMTLANYELLKLVCFGSNRIPDLELYKLNNIKHVASTNAEVNEINLHRLASFLSDKPPGYPVCRFPGWDSKNGDTYLSNEAAGLLECNLATGWGLMNGAGLVVKHILYNPDSEKSQFPNWSFVPTRGRRSNTSPALVFCKFDADRGEDPGWLLWIRSKHRLRI